MLLIDVVNDKLVTVHVTTTLNVCVVCVTVLGYVVDVTVTVNSVVPISVGATRLDAFNDIMPSE